MIAPLEGEAEGVVEGVGDGVGDGEGQGGVEMLKGLPIEGRETSEVADVT